MIKLKGGDAMKFGFEDLEVWDKAVNFAVDVIDKVEAISSHDRRHYRLFEQVESCSTSVAMNIAEGEGRFSKKEFTRYLYVARGSLYETMTLLEILRRLKWIPDESVDEIAKQGKEIASMTKGLINSLC